MAEQIPSVDSLVVQAKAIFAKEFNDEATIAVVAPGRVNLIGEHVDYNDGFVMPMALPLVTVIVGKQSPKSDDTTTIITSSNDVDKPWKTTIDMPNQKALVRTITPGPPKWSNYIKGVLSNYIGNCYIPAFNAVIVSTVPNGGGLSSSAALEVATYTFVDALTGQDTASEIDKALACQKAEHDYAHVPCGIMDQFISLMGKEGHALLIDCRNLGSTLIPMQDPDIVVLITNSNVKHELSGSEYATRKKQCHEAALILKKLSLRDATMSDIQHLITINTSEAVVKRARHAVTEIARTVQASEALKVKNYARFGQLMVESHQSLRDDYQVSCVELDQLVELALQTDGVLGSRMTGAGFGGCTVTLVKANAVQKVIDHIKKNYITKKPTFYICKPSNGARILSK